MFDIKNLTGVIPFLFILSASILTNYAQDVLGCKIQNIFSINPYLKHVTLIFLIYTSLTIFDKKTTPKEHFIKSILIWFLFILFTKNLLRTTIIIYIFMIILFINEDYINYYTNIKNEEKVKQLTKISTYLKYIILILIVLGHILYVIKQSNNFGKDFNIIKLYRGTNCILL
tara:strand:- start:2487 stop:3002 length:516 start_codon:yes stop_codon:yes gene_type:complete